MTTAERRWVWMYSLGLALLCTLPYLIGFTRAGTDWAFSGFVIGVEDGNSYIAKMLSGSYGDWLFRTPYTTMAQPGELIFIPYLLLGKLAQPPELHLQLVMLFQLFRLVVTPYAVFSIYRFVALFLREASGRRWVTVLSTFGGGLGWIVPLLGDSNWLGSIPLDFMSPETFGFLAFLGLPHLILARGLMFSALHAYLQDGETRAASYSSGVHLLLLTLVQSLSTLSAFAVIAIHQVQVMLTGSHEQRLEWRKTWLGAALRAGLPSIPLIVYYIIRFSSDPFLQAWTDQNRILSPHPLHYFLAYGLLILPVAAALRKKPWLEKRMWLLPVGWIIVLPLLAYFPHNLQRRLVEGVWVALLTLAGFVLVNGKPSRPGLRTVPIVLIGLSVVSPILLVIGTVLVGFTPSSPAFLPADRVQAFRWLEQNAPRASIVLADYNSSNALPAWAPIRVVIGHGPESVGLDRLQPEVEAFYGSALSSRERVEWLEEQEIDYILVGGEEVIPSRWDPNQEPYLIRTYQDKGIAIYEVQDAQD